MDNKEVLNLLKTLLCDDKANNKDIEENITPFVPHPFIVGEKYFIRTVTLYFTGILQEVYPNELVLNNVTWIADTGRFGEAIKTGIFDEQEYYGDNVIIQRGSIIDCQPVKFNLITTTK